MVLVTFTKYTEIFLFRTLYFRSVGFYQMAKIAVTPSIVLAEFILIGKRVSYVKVSRDLFNRIWIYLFLLLP